MKSPKQMLTKVFSPIYQAYNKTISRDARNKCYQGIANFIFEHSKETALIMLVFNSISIMASHFSQIGGLKKSKRENKDYLINQERKELGLDLLLTIIPPFIIHNALMKKLDSGQWTTKSARTKLLNIVTDRQPAYREELYNTDHIAPVRETVGNIANSVLKRISKFEKLPQNFKNIVENKIKPEPINVKVPSVPLEEFLLESEFKNKDFDSRNMRLSRSGMLIMATVGYTILATAVIMPILKNILSNKSYEKELHRNGETKESIKRKQRYNNLSIANISCEKFANENIMKRNNNLYRHNVVFDQINSNSNAFSMNGLRI